MQRAQALTLLATAATVAPTVVRAQATATLRVGAATNDTFMEAHYGYEAGIFAKYGLTLEITDLPNSAAIVAGVSGALDLGMRPDPARRPDRRAQMAYLRACLYRSEAPQTLLCVSRTGPVQRAKDPGQTISVVALNRSARCRDRIAHAQQR